MFDAETLGVIAQLGLGLAGFSGIALVLMRRGSEFSRLESDRLAIMLSVSLGATFLAVLPLVLSDLPAETECNVVSAVMAVYTAVFLSYFVKATLKIKSSAPELFNPWAFGLVVAGHVGNLVLQIASAGEIVKCSTAYRVGLFWMLFHGAYQFARILFIRPRHINGVGAESDTSAIPGPSLDTQDLSREV